MPWLLYSAPLALCSRNSPAPLELSHRLQMVFSHSSVHRAELIARLRVITGLSNLNFETDGTLRFDVNQVSGGSASARELLSQAVQGANVIVLEDASSRSDVAFCRVVRGRWTRDESSRPPAYVVLIDFTDFRQLSGDAEARAAFDVGWGLLHEIDHVVSGSEDAKDEKGTGDCEDHINEMRLEVGLPVRTNYFFTRAYLKADANLNARYVRLLRTARSLTNQTLLAGLGCRQCGWSNRRRSTRPRPLTICSICVFL